MRPERGGSARRLACQIALGSLIGAATAAGTTLVSAAPSASASSCSTAFAQVEGGRSSSHYGVRADVYVNTNSTVNAYSSDGFVRSLAVILNSNNWVEVGWSAHIEGTTSPQVFAEWQNTSGSSNHGFKNYKLVSYDTNRTFWLVNLPGGNPIFQFWFDGDSSPFAYSPTMAFGTAPPLGNSERHNWCQSLYAHMYNLNDYTSSGWETWDSWNACLNSTARNPYYMHRDSDTEFHVTNNSGGKMC